jgi:hypothetical protein
MPVKSKRVNRFHRLSDERPWQIAHRKAGLKSPAPRIASEMRLGVRTSMAKLPPS